MLCELIKHKTVLFLYQPLAYPLGEFQEIARYLWSISVQQTSGCSTSKLGASTGSRVQHRKNLITTVVFMPMPITPPFRAADYGGGTRPQYHPDRCASTIHLPSVQDGRSRPLACHAERDRWGGRTYTSRCAGGAVFLKSKTGGRPHDAYRWNTGIFGVEVVNPNLIIRAAAIIDSQPIKGDEVAPTIRKNMWHLFAQVVCDINLAGIRCTQLLARVLRFTEMRIASQTRACQNQFAL